MKKQRVFDENSTFETLNCMKTRNILKLTMVVLVLFAFSFSVSGQIEFTEIRTEEDWNLLVDKAKKQDKLIFLDIYATWCGPCKMLDRDVYPDPDLGAYYNENFINAKMDGETEFGRKKARQYALRAYPTMYYTSATDHVIGSVLGVKQSPALIDFGKKLLLKSHEMLSLSKGYESGKLKAEELLKFRNLLSEFGVEAKAGEVGQSILPALTSDQLFDPEFTEIIITSPSNLDGKVFQALKNYPGKADTLWSPEQRSQVFASIFDASMQTAIETKSFEYRDRIINELLPVYFPGNLENQKRAGFITYKLFDANTGNWEGFESRIMDQFTSADSTDDAFLYSQAYEIINTYGQSKEALEIGVRLMDKAVELNPVFDNIVMLAYLSGMTGKYDKARTVLQKAQPLAASDDQKKIVAELEGIIDKVEADKQ